MLWPEMNAEFVALGRKGRRPADDHAAAGNHRRCRVGDARPRRAGVGHQRTVLIISHNIRYILPVVDENAVMYHGRVVASYDHNSCDADVIEELIMSGPEGLSDE
jgi:hypothetical protein